MIDTEGLTRKFGDHVAVENLTLHVDEGEVFGFLGPNGAGKTTTVRMLSCLISKSEGSARVAGFDVSDPDQALEIRRRVGLLPENVGLSEALSAYRNLDFYARLYGVPDSRRAESIEKLLRLLDLWDKRDQLVGSFSKGMKQKVAIARALVHDPQVLFLDEPTANLDPEATNTVRNFILDLKKEKRTIFLTTHNLDEAQRVCDRVGVLKTRMLKVGSPDELRASLWGSRTTVQVERADEALRASVESRWQRSSVRLVDRTLVFDVTNPDLENPDIVAAVVAAGGRIQRVSEQTPSLEDVYLKLVRG